VNERHHDHAHLLHIHVRCPVELLLPEDGKPFGRSGIIDHPFSRILNACDIRVGLQGVKGPGLVKLLGWMGAPRDQLETLAVIVKK
jgi:hypothetical protein